MSKDAAAVIDGLTRESSQDVRNVGELQRAPAQAAGAATRRGGMRRHDGTQ
jgi:hypothetical protein